ncbi:MAG: autotransporter domain-containing protein, partial [Alphaproteobacteria bacterium]|nr:autotransporter domain-containing protein [Alphaproteobacteria bacterium]
SFTGLTTVSAGTLVLGTAAGQFAAVGGALSVATGATLNGVGSIGGNLTNAGTVRPITGANAPANLNVLGNYVQTSTGTLNLAMTPAANSRLVVTGSATLAGALTLTPATGSYTPNSTITLVTAGGGVTGTFGTLNGALSINGIQLVPVYLPNRVDLVLAALTVDTSKPVFNQNDPAAQQSVIVFDGGTYQPNSNQTVNQPATVNATGGSSNSSNGNIVFTNMIGGAGGFTFGGTRMTNVMGGTNLGGGIIVTGGMMGANSNINAFSMTVTNSGTLRGTGTINAPTNVSGNLMPGSSPGTLTFSAPVTMTAGSLLTLEIDGTGTANGAGNFSRVVVQGAAFNAAGTIVPVLRGIGAPANNTFTPAVGTGFRVVTASAINGSFAGLTQPASGLLPGSRIDALYQPTAITLFATPTSYQNMAPLGLTLTPNQRSVAVALDALRTAPGVRASADVSTGLAAVFPLTTPQIGDAMVRLGAGINGDMLLSGVETNRLFTGAVGNRLAATRGLSSANGSSTVQGGHHTAWFTGLGRTASASAAAGTTGYNSSNGGVAVGVDMRVGEGGIVGVAAGYVEGVVTSSLTGGRSSTSHGFLSAYGTYTQGMAFVDAVVAGTVGTARITRNLGPIGMGTSASPGVSGFSARGDAGLRLQAGDWLVQPSVGFRVDTYSRNAVTETGAGVLGMNVNSGSLTASSAVIGVSASTRVAVSPTMTLTPTAQLQYGYEFGNVMTTTTGTLIGVPGVGVRTDSTTLGRNRLMAGVGATLQITQNASLFGNYGLDVRQRSTGHNFSAGLRWNW